MLLKKDRDQAMLLLVLEEPAEPLEQVLIHRLIITKWQVEEEKSIKTTGMKATPKEGLAFSQVDKEICFRKIMTPELLKKARIRFQ